MKELIRSFTGADNDAQVESNWKGTYWVTTWNIDTGKSTTKRFRGNNARERALDYAQSHADWKLARQ